MTLRPKRLMLQLEVLKMVVTLKRQKNPIQGSKRT